MCRRNNNLVVVYGVRKHTPTDIDDNVDMLPRKPAAFRPRRKKKSDGILRENNNANRWKYFSVERSASINVLQHVIST